MIELVGKIRERVPGIALRTTLIVGYPAEGEKEFLELLDFVNETRFDRLGVFTYSLEDGTTAYPLGNPVPEEEKTRRIIALQALQRRIQTELNQALIGREVEVLIDAASKRRDTELSGRTSQNIVVNVPGPASWIGRTVAVRVSRAGAHSVWGEAV